MWHTRPVPGEKEGVAGPSLGQSPAVLCVLHSCCHWEKQFVNFIPSSALWSGDLIGFDLPRIPFQLGQTLHFKLKLEL